MKDEQPLVDRYLDGELTPEEQGRLTEWLAPDASHVRQFVRETSLHRQIREAMLARPHHAYGLSEVKSSEPKERPLPVRRLARQWVKSRATQVGRVTPCAPQTQIRHPNGAHGVTRPTNFFAEFICDRTSWTLAAAACLLLLVALSLFWWFGAVMGKPALAEVNGVGLSLERGGQPLPAFAGRRLQSGDVLRTPKNVTATISFAPENTRITLQPGTDLKLVSMSRGKRFALGIGKLEATVARQRPFLPMVLMTPQAEARVIGTEFTLLAATNATRLEVTEGNVKLTRTSDETEVKVGAGHYAVAAANYELVALPQTGGLLREWWTGVKGKTRFSLSEDPRFPDQPDGRTTVPDFELKITETNQFAVRLCGYVHPPVTGDYQFWLERPPADFAAVGFANLMMSPTESPSEADPIAQTSGGGSSISSYVTVGTTAASLPIPLQAGKRYYLEARMVIGRGTGELSVAWQPPGQAREVLKSKFLSPWKPK